MTFHIDRLLSLASYSLRKCLSNRLPREPEQLFTSRQRNVEDDGGVGGLELGVADGGVDELRVPVRRAARTVPDVPKDVVLRTDPGGDLWGKR